MQRESRAKLTPSDARKSQFAALDDGSIYLNSASAGPLPADAIAALSRANTDRGRPATWPLERINGVLDESRALAARLVNGSPAEIALMPNTTTGLNIAARALPLKRGDIVLTFDGEFPANIYPWLRLHENGVVLERIPSTAAGWPDEMRMLDRLRDPRVRAVTVSLTQFSSGYTVDLAALSTATRETGKWLVVDAIQGVGQLPVDLAKTPVDFLACGAQKWLLSPWGTGFLYVRKELATQLEPTFAGWAAFMGSDDYTRLTSYDPRFWPDARRFELLTHAVQDFTAMNASASLILDVGVAEIAAHVRTLHRPIIEWAERTGARITSPPGARGSAILCVRPADNVSLLHARLQEGGVHCSLREGSIRLSPHLFNTLAELDRVAQLLDNRS